MTAPPLELLHPLPDLYSAAGHALPEFELIDAAVLCPAARRLLAHSGDMTSKLEEFFSDEMRLRVLQCDHTAEHYRREVILFGKESGLPVEYGAIEINLLAFEEPVRAEIIRGEVPLGGLLNRHGLRYRSEPRAFLRVSRCSRMSDLFQVPASALHYARSNRLLDSEENELASIVEILRPV